MHEVISYSIVLTYHLIGSFDKLVTEATFEQWLAKEDSSIYKYASLPEAE